MNQTIRTVLVGAAGYTGAELAGLLAGHPNTDLVGVFGSERRSAEGEPALSALFPRLRGLVDLPVRAASVAAASVFRSTGAAPLVRSRSQMVCGSPPCRSASENSPTRVAISE